MIRSSLLLLAIALFAAPAPAQTPAAREQIDFDAFGNVVRNADGATYVFEEGDRPELPPQAATPSASGASGPAALPPELGTVVLDPVFDYSVWGTALGRTGLEVADLDGDGTLEIVLGASLGGGFGANSAWHVVQRIPATGEYEKIFTSSEYESSVSRVIVETLGGRPRVLVGLSSGALRVYDGATRAFETEVQVAPRSLNDLILADADNDGAEELLVLTSSSLHLLDPLTLVEESEHPYGGTDAAVGQVDDDDALEVVVTGGYVLQIDGPLATVEWDRGSEGFGILVELLDVDGDTRDEIIAAQPWYYIDVFDAEVRSPRDQFRTQLNIHALLIADVTGDGQAEILYGDAQWGSIHALDVDGDELWSIRNPEHGTTRIGVSDVDGDGELEVMWGGGFTSTGEDFFFIADVATQLTEYQSVDLVGPFKAVTRGDSDGDGASEIVAISNESNSGYSDGVVHVWDEDSFALEWRSPPDVFQRFAWTGVHDVAVGDPDGDDTPEIVVATDRLRDGRLYVIDGTTDTVEASHAYDDNAMGAVEITEMDGDATPELVAVSTPVYQIDGATGDVEWNSVDLSSFGGAFVLEVGDVVGDATPDLVVVKGAIYVIDGATRVQQRSVETDYRSLALADHDGDGQTEIWAGTRYGFLRRLDPSTLASVEVAELCDSSLNSVRLRTAATLDRAIAFACDDGIGLYDDVEDGILWRSPSLGRSVGLNNNLVVHDHGARLRMIVGTRHGVKVYEGFGPSDPDVDQDGVLNHLDVCPEVADDQSDTDGDGVGDACNDSLDGDGDEWADRLDVCPDVADDQSDTDGDREGDACNDAGDLDGDEWGDLLDNCIDVPNDQANRDGDGLGDACDPYPDDPDNFAARCEEAIAAEARLAVELDACLERPMFVDVDGDGEHDGTDRCPGSPAGQAVDAAGCTAMQFCAAQTQDACRQADWRNDEPLGKAKDCERFAPIQGPKICVEADSTTTLPKDPKKDASCGLGPGLAAVLPLLSGLRRRRRRKVAPGLGLAGRSKAGW